MSIPDITAAGITLDNYGGTFPAQHREAAHRSRPSSECRLCNPRETRRGDRTHHGTTRDDMLVCREPVKEAKDDMSRHKTTRTPIGMESNTELR